MAVADCVEKRLREATAKEFGLDVKTTEFENFKNASPLQSPGQKCHQRGPRPLVEKIHVYLSVANTLTLHDKGSRYCANHWAGQTDS